MYIPFEGVKTTLQDLPLLGADLFSGQFQEVLEKEAKRIDTTNKLSLNKGAVTARGRGASKKTFGTVSYRPKARKPFKKFQNSGQQSQKTSPGATVAAARPQPTPQPPRPNFQSGNRGRGGRQPYNPRGGWRR